ncbi:MAG TPA: serine/threonine-protein kinase [Acidimicrobiia bacterium]|jgi:serine/threonine protein kinase|nr:serine/threonine-protein kinase [Acidimicrobiia bacterium]
MPQLVDDRYELVDVLASGGMATVWRARDTRLNRLVALKRPHPAPIENKVHERMAREARAAAGVTHPNLVTMFDTGVDQHGPYLVMELVSGPTLAAPGREISVSEAIGIGAQLADALAAVHEAGVVHRDVKPANVILSPDGPRLTDFGIASIEEGTSELTLPGTVLATPSFGAPEVLEGGAPTPASDVFSLAALIYGLISGRPAFADTNRADPPPPLADAALDRVLRPALAAEPGQRPSARELAAGLRGGAPTTGITTVPASVATPTALGGSTEVLEAIDSPPPLPPTAPPPKLVKPRRSSMLVWVGLGLVILLSAVLVLPLLLDDQPARAVSASTVTSLPVTTPAPVTTSTAPATTVPPTTLVDDLTRARNQLASVLATVGPPELKPKEEDEILKKVEQAVSKSFDKPEEAAKELREAANLISKELDGDSEREALTAIDDIAAALGLDLSEDGD